MAVKHDVMAGSAEEAKEPYCPSVSTEREKSTHALDSTDYAPGIEAAFPREFEEGARAVRCVEGAIPKFVRGTYYLNGPARFAIGEITYKHWLDGDGMVCAIRFSEEEVRLTNRYVGSRKHELEKQSGRGLFRTFGTSFPGSQLNRVNNGTESPVNVSVYRFGNELLAFGEQGLPWALDPYTLETRGQFTFNGRLNEASPFAAHPKFDFETEEMFNFGIFFSDNAPRLYLYCFAATGLRYRRSAPLPYPCSVHDFSLSKNYAIFYLSPYLFDIQGLLRKGQSVLESLQWRPECGSLMVVLDRHSGEIVASVSVGQRYCLHLMNSFERGGVLTVDVLEFDAPIYGEYQPIPEMFQTVSQGGPVRYEIDLRNRKVMNHIVRPCLCSPDFPAIDSRRAMRAYEDFWMLGISSAGKGGRKFFDQLVHGAWNAEGDDVYQSGPKRYLSGEPVLIGDPESEEAVVLCQEVDVVQRASYFVLFDARNVKRGPIARIAAGQLLYCGFHAAFYHEL